MPSPCPTLLPVPSSDLEVQNKSCNQDTQALQKVPNHMDEGGSDTGVLLRLAGVIVAVSMAVTVPMARLVKGQPHSMEVETKPRAH